MVVLGHFGHIKSINKNIFNNFLITTPRHIHTLLFKKLLSPASTSTPAPKSEFALMLDTLCQIY